MSAAKESQESAMSTRHTPCVFTRGQLCSETPILIAECPGGGEVSGGAGYQPDGACKRRRSVQPTHPPARWELPGSPRTEFIWKTVSHESDLSSAYLDFLLLQRHFEKLIYLHYWVPFCSPFFIKQTLARTHKIFLVICLSKMINLGLSTRNWALL